MDVHTRIREARARLKMTEEQFGRLVGVSRTAVQQWENGTTAPSRTRQPEVARALGITVGQLMSHSNGFGGATDSGGDVPLLPRQLVTSWIHARMRKAVGAEQWLACPIEHGPRTFALRVWGDSMTAASVRSYPAGCIIFIDADRLEPSDGERVVAIPTSRQEVTFKTFKEDDGRRWLQPLNPAHEPIREPFRIVGTVIGKWEDG